MKAIKIVYCSWSDFKKEEWQLAKQHLELPSKPGKKLGELFELEFRQAPTSEPLLCDLESMVKAKIASAYRQVQVPCIVEHAGLILGGYEDKSFPGGLTQPMWDSLDAEKFVGCCVSLSTKAIARAVVGYYVIAEKTLIDSSVHYLSRFQRRQRLRQYDLSHSEVGLIVPIPVVGRILQGNRLLFVSAHPLFQNLTLTSRRQSVYVDWAETAA